MARSGLPPAPSSVYTWGGGITVPLRLPMLSAEVVQVSTGRTQKAGVTKSGRLIMWEVSGSRREEFHWFSWFCLSLGMFWYPCRKLSR